MELISQKSIFSFNFSVLNFTDAVSAIIRLAEKKNSAYICVSNVHMVMEAKKDVAFGMVLQHADMAVLDGMPLCWSMALLHGIKTDRIAGRHLMDAILQKCAVQQLPVYFYGGKAATLERAVSFIKKNYNGIQVVGSYSPPFRPLSDEEDLEVIRKIKESGAAIVFVALGCPKQEKWMAHMKNRIPAVMLGIGVALEVLTQQQKSTPMWMERYGLEWFFRLCKEPRRLFKRYLITNTGFVFLLLRTLLSKRNQGK
ncbi:WecB/TagA/CpsF family glycosyltransferase [Pedobacter sp. N23S346]|uniref:WecB/TagA/CpsF family glycosyltransferase n=1 Tax=Pedobacter sp. N23S346 TaxID=3402750 RepID=UPI003AD0F80E